MSIELILLAVNINLVAFSCHSAIWSARCFALLVLTVAAAEAAIGLAILVVYFLNRGSIAVEDINLMKGEPPLCIRRSSSPVAGCIARRVIRSLARARAIRAAVRPTATYHAAHDHADERLPLSTCA